MDDGIDRQPTIFQGRVTSKNDLLDGKLSSGDTEFKLGMLRIGQPIIGRWELQTGRTNVQDLPETGRPPDAVKQRLIVNPDLSGWYGPYRIDQVMLEGADQYAMLLGDDRRPKGNRVAFTAKSGDTELEFVGQLTAQSLSGQLTTPDSKLPVTGTRTAEFWNLDR